MPSWQPVTSWSSSESDSCESSSMARTSQLAKAALNASKKALVICFVLRPPPRFRVRLYVKPNLRMMQCASCLDTLTCHRSFKNCTTSIAEQRVLAVMKACTDTTIASLRVAGRGLRAAGFEHIVHLHTDAMLTWQTLAVIRMLPKYAYTRRTASLNEMLYIRRKYRNPVDRRSHFSHTFLDAH